VSAKSPCVAWCASRVRQAQCPQHRLRSRRDGWRIADRLRQH
jgi:hypothetical protein